MSDIFPNLNGKAILPLDESEGPGFNKYIANGCLRKDGSILKLSNCENIISDCGKKKESLRNRFVQKIEHD
jgi:hypothetical protein